MRKLLRHFPASVTYPVALAFLACAEVLIRLGGPHENLSLALLLGVCTTLPLTFVLGADRALPARAGAAVAVTSAGVLALAPFRTLTLAGWRPSWPRCTGWDGRGRPGSAECSSCRMSCWLSSVRTTSPPG
ncbi:hypothetical protein O1M63_36325 [Streptomyces mirabilis]|nr:hypothetical protein [Streptomyces mirabilis]